MYKIYLILNCVGNKYSQFIEVKTAITKAFTKFITKATLIRIMTPSFPSTPPSAT